jgi:hypothetical protein
MVLVGDCLPILLRFCFGMRLVSSAFKRGNVGTVCQNFLFVSEWRAVTSFIEYRYRFVSETATLYGGGQNLELLSGTRCVNLQGCFAAVPNKITVKRGWHPA